MKRYLRSTFMKLKDRFGPGNPSSNNLNKIASQSLQFSQVVTELKELNLLLSQSLQFSQSVEIDYSVEQTLQFSQVVTELKELNLLLSQSLQFSQSVVEELVTASMGSFQVEGQFVQITSVREFQSSSIFIQEGS